MMITNPQASFMAPMTHYPFKGYRKVAFVNSTGICNLDCPYCFTNQNKQPMGLDKGDMDFLFESFGDNFLLCFSGQGDFFAGYQKKDRFLEHILQYNVQLYLDFNGVLVHELLEIPSANLDKVLHFDVSFHYETMRDKGFLEAWANNIRALSAQVDSARWDVKGIVSMNTLEQLNDKLKFYAEEMYPATGKALQLKLDDFDNTIYEAPVVKFINSMVQKYPQEVVQTTFKPKARNQKTNQEEYVVATERELFCPAGSLFFKIGLNGNVVPCNKLGAQSLTLGNLKKRELSFMTQLVPCARLRGPGCLVNWDMKYPIR